MTRSNRTRLSFYAAIAALVFAGTAHADEGMPKDGYTALDRYVAPKSEVKRWFAAPSGASLHETLDRWAAQAGWKAVVWKLPEDTDFTLGQARRFDGNVEQAAKSLIEAIGAEANLVLHADQATRTLTVTAEQ
jgi:hypothetical protein